MLISLADGFRPVPAEIATPPFPEDHRVPNCESDGYVWLLEQEGRARLEFAVLNPQGVSAMALAAVLKRGLEGERLEDIAGLDESLVEEIFTKELSTGKMAGLLSMVKLVKRMAANMIAGKKS